TGTLRLAEPVRVARLPPRQRRGPAVLTLMALTLLIGAALIALREGLRPSHVRSTLPVTPRAPVRADDGLLSDGNRFAMVPSIHPAAALLLARSELQRGFRTLIASEAPGRDADVEALELAKALSEAERKVVVVYWRLEGSDLPATGGRAASGLND